MNKVRAKFTCYAVIPANHSNMSVTAHFHAVYSNDGENADYCKATPCGNLNISIDKDTPASNFFEQGKNYYLDFTEAL